jgi:hypothetical protein
MYDTADIEEKPVPKRNRQCYDTLQSKVFATSDLSYTTNWLFNIRNVLVSNLCIHNH